MTQALKLQSSACGLKFAIDLLKSLYVFTDDLRNRFDDIEQRAIDISGTSEYVSVTDRRRKRTRRFDDGQAADTVLPGKDKFRIETFTVINSQPPSSSVSHCHHQSATVIISQPLSSSVSNCHHQSATVVINQLVCSLENWRIHKSARSV